MTMTYGQIQDGLRAAIAASVAADPETDDSYVWVIDFSDTYVVYEIDFNEYLQDDYSMADDGSIVLAGNPQPVKSITTYVPLGADSAGIETRGALSRRDARGRPARATSVTVKSEPLTYHRWARHSYYRDLLLTDRMPGAAGRLERHAQEMRVIDAERNELIWRSLRSGNFETRVEPNRTDGQGGYFSPPIWLNELFATAKRPGRILAGLMPRFELPPGVSQINLPIIGTGTTTGAMADNEGVPGQDITDSAGSSTVVTLAGQADVALQALEQSPAGAMLDWALLMDMAEDYDRDLETQLLIGTGSANNQLLGIQTADTTITYTDASPTGSRMFPYFGQAAGQLGDSRLLPPEVWLMRTARWSWLTTQEDTAGRPFGISTPFFLGSDEETPDPVGGLISWPVFLDDAIPATQGAGANQDFIACLRPTDLILLEGPIQTAVMREPLSGALGARIQLHGSVAAITNRYTSGIWVIQGTGTVVQTNY